MRKRVLAASATTVAAVVVSVVVVGAVVVAGTAAAESDPASAGHRGDVTVRVVEKGTSINFVDVAPADSALGDQLIGTGDLVDPTGRKVGTSSFVGTSTDAKPRTSELLTFVYDLGDGKVATTGTARLSTTGPVFDEVFAVTGGTGRYAGATGQVHVVQRTTDQADVTVTVQLGAGR